jgi:hypothetical protein
MTRGRMEPARGGGTPGVAHTASDGTRTGYAASIHAVCVRPPVRPGPPPRDGVQPIPLFGHIDPGRITACLSEPCQDVVRPQASPEHSPEA